MRIAHAHMQAPVSSAVWAILSLLEPHVGRMVSGPDEESSAGSRIPGGGNCTKGGWPSGPRATTWKMEAGAMHLLVVACVVSAMQQHKDGKDGHCVHVHTYE